MQRATSTFWEISSVLIAMLCQFLLIPGRALKQQNKSFIKVVKFNKGIKLTLITLKSLRELLHFTAIHNILVHSK